MTLRDPDFETHETDVLTTLEEDVPAMRGSELLRRYAPAMVALVAVIVAWEGLVRAFSVQSFILPRPSEIITEFFANASVIWSNGYRTLQEAVGGFIVGTMLGVAVALATVRWAGFREGFLPFAIAANSVPIIALAPITNAMFSITSPASKIAVVAVVVFFPVMINTARGLVEVDPAEIELMRSYAATPREVMLRVRIPHALPYFFSALKVGSALSIIAAIVAEYFGGPQDVLGQYIVNRAQLFQFPDAWAAILVASIMGLTLYALVLLAERLVMPWHVSFRSEERP